MCNINSRITLLVSLVIKLSNILHNKAVLLTKPAQKAAADILPEATKKPKK